MSIAFRRADIDRGPCPIDISIGLVSLSIAYWNNQAADVTGHSITDKVCCSTGMGFYTAFAFGGSCSDVVSRYEANGGQDYLQQAMAKAGIRNSWYPHSSRGSCCCVTEHFQTYTRRSCSRRSLPEADAEVDGSCALSFVEDSSAPKSDNSCQLLQGAGGGSRRRSGGGRSSYGSRRRTCRTVPYSCNYRCVCV